MAKIWVDGRTYEVNEEHNLLQAVLSAKLSLPYFCWHPAMGSVGACRQCAVIMYRDEKDTRGRLTMACMTPAKDGTRISIDAPDAREFRRRVIEWLMVNHPHDCPVCDEGGECHLQDMTLMTGHNYREYRFTKRTHRNQNLGPFVNHEMNRCIACYRCVRYYRDYAGGKDFDVFAAHDHVYFGRADDGVLENEFSGNLVEVCPTGVFTDKTLGRHYTRKWDLQSAPSVCNHCSVGCNTLAGERYGQLRRIRNRYNHEVNGYFLCDRGRFGYEFVNGIHRVRTPLVSEASVPAQTDGTAAVAAAGQLLRRGSIIGIGSPRATLESNFALKTFVGEGNFSTGMSDLEQRLVSEAYRIVSSTPVRIASLQDIQESDAVVVLGEDLTNTAPMIALAVRQSIRNAPMAMTKKAGIPAWNDAATREMVQDQNGPLFVITPSATSLDDAATAVHRMLPDDIAMFGSAIAAAIEPGAPGAEGAQHDVRVAARSIAGALTSATRPLIISGTSLFHEGILHAAANIAAALVRAGHQPRIALAVPECNSLGVTMLGGKSIEQLFDSAGEGAVAVVVENDLYRRLPANVVDTYLSRCRAVIVLDSILHRTTSKAQVVFPASSFAEGDGTLVSYEGRAQRYFQVFPAADDIRESWRWLHELMAFASSGARDGWVTLDEVATAAFDAIPALRGKSHQVAPPASFNVEGLKIARQPHRFSGRTAMFANATLHEPPPPPDPDSPLTFSMEGIHREANPALIPYFWSPGWNSVQATQWYQQEVGGALIGGDPGVRVFAETPGSSMEYARDAQRRDTGTGEWLAVPLYHIFGSEELSALSDSIMERIPVPYVALNRKAAEQLGAVENERLMVSLGEAVLTLPLKILPDLPDGAMGIPYGLRGLEGLPPGIRGTLKVESRT